MTRSPDRRILHGLARTALAWILLLAGCGAREQEFTLLLRDADNQPVRAIEAKLVGTDRRLGVSDEKGRITCMLPTKGAGPNRIRLSQESGNSGPQYTLESAYEIDDAALASGVKTIWLEPAGKSAEPGVVSLTVTSDPSGATVILDGTERGPTPARLADVPPGRHHVEVTLAGHLPYAWDIVLEGAASELHAPLAPSGNARASVNVVSDPAGAMIKLDGRSTGQGTPALLADLAPGQHRIELELAGYDTWQGTVQLAAGGQPGSGGGVLRPRGAPPTRETASARPKATTPAAPPSFTREYLIGTSPGWAEVYLNQDPANRNQAGRFRAALPGGWNSFQVRNPRIGVDVTLRYEVRADDPNTKLVLDYNQARVIPSP